MVLFKGKKKAKEKMGDGWWMMGGGTAPCCFRTFSNKSHVNPNTSSPPQNSCCHFYIQVGHSPYLLMLPYNNKSP